MLAPDTLAQLSPLERLGRLQAEALAHYGTERHNTAIARDFGYHRITVQHWMDAPERIPAAVILCLAAWNHHRQFRAQLSDQIGQRATDLTQLAETTARNTGE